MIWGFFRLRVLRWIASQFTTIQMSRKRDSQALTAPPRATRRQRTESVDEFIAANRNANTHATFSSGWRSFTRWVTEVENPLRRADDAVDEERPSDSDIAAYMKYIVIDCGKTIATATSAMCAIADHIRLITTATYDPCNSVRVKRMKAVLVPLAKPATQKRAITWRQLKDIYDVCEATAAKTDAGRIARRDSLMFMLAYFGYLRVSEIARMLRSDITFTDDTPTTTMHIHVNRLSKNDTERKGHERLIAARTGTAHCIVAQMQRYLAGTSHAAQQLFSTTAGKRMSNDTPRGRLRYWLTETGVRDPSMYGFHSMRAGAATDAANAGVEERDIKAHGNWKSDAYKVYIRASVESRVAVGNALGAH